MTRPSRKRRRLAAALALCCVAFAAPRPVRAENFANGPPEDGSFFPLGVWLQSPENAAKYRAIGVNMFVGLYEGPTERQLALLARNGMFVVADQNATALASANRGVIKGWLDARDEPDNAQALAGGGYGACIPPDEVVRRSREMKSRDPTRPVMVGFGQGVANPWWLGRGPCNGDMGYYDAAKQGADIVGFDIYPVGSETPQLKGKLEYVARGVAFLRARATPGQVVWNAIETTALDPEHPPRPEQVRAEIWMSIIHGSRGIIYFVHEFKPRFREDALFAHPAVVAEVRRANALIASLAPVLNSPDMSPDLRPDLRPDLGKVAVAADAPVATLAKQRDGAFYLFAVAMSNQPTEARFELTGASDGVAEVIGEGREISVSNGILRDHFDGYGVHIYRTTAVRTQ